MHAMFAEEASQQKNNMIPIGCSTEKSKSYGYGTGDIFYIKNVIINKRSTPCYYCH
jgi:hypothetical protein